MYSWGVRLTWFDCNAIQSSVNIMDLRLGFHRKKKPILLARETPLKVSGNLNAIQSSVNIMDLRLGFHRKKKSLYYLHVRHT